jgi:formate hydrogenlyase subunit 3/multisubunit Na+/H+ antiporter MnhD subunit
MPAETSLQIGDGSIVGSAFIRLFALLGAIVTLGLAVLGAMTVGHRHAPGVLLAGLGAAILTLALPDTRIAVVAATVGGLIGIVVTVVRQATAREAVVAVRELRAVAIAGALAVLATAWIGRPLGELAAEPAVFGFAYLGFALAVAIRFGAIPFHFWAARLADAAPEIALPLLMAWGPAAFAVVALAWTDQSIAPLLMPLGFERAVVAGIGAITVVLGAVAAWVQDDLEHVVGYTIIADAGLVLLGLAAAGPEFTAAWEPARTWILIFLMTRSAFAAWAVAVRGTFGTRRIPDLKGWAFRAPVLAIAFLAIVAASIGWPGLVAWEARATLIDLALDPPLAIVVLVGAIAPLAVYVRLAMLGVGRRTPAVDGAPSERPTWPAAIPSRPMLGRGGLERGFERTGHLIAAVLDVLWTVPAAVRANRTPIAAAIVLALAGLSFAVASGGLGVPEAARALPPQVGEPGPSQPGAGESPAASEPPASSDRPPPGSESAPASEPPSPSSSEPSFQPIP